MSADWWQIQQQLEYRRWLDDQAGIAEYESWLTMLDQQHRIEQEEPEYATHD